MVHVRTVSDGLGRNDRTDGSSQQRRGLAPCVASPKPPPGPERMIRPPPLTRLHGPLLQPEADSGAGEPPLVVGVAGDDRRGRAHSPDEGHQHAPAGQRVDGQCGVAHSRPSVPTRTHPMSCGRPHRVGRRVRQQWSDVRQSRGVGRQLGQSARPPRATGRGRSASVKYTMTRPPAGTAVEYHQPSGAAATRAGPVPSASATCAATPMSRSTCSVRPPRRRATRRRRPVASITHRTIASRTARPSLQRNLILQVDVTTSTSSP